MLSKVIDNLRSDGPRLSCLLRIGSFAIAIVVGVLGPQPAHGQEPVSTDGAYRLGPSDVIRVTVLKQDLLTQDGVRIGNDGMIRLPMLDEPVRAACMTEAELASVISERYRKYILSPQVYVSTREFNSNTIAVIGAVNTPGRFQLQRPIRLLEILTLVNGPAPNAGSELQILRTMGPDLCSERSNHDAFQVTAGDSDPEILSLKLDEVLDGLGNANPFLRGGDIVRIVQAEQKQAYVIGSVRSATTVNLKDPVTLSTAIAMAGGAVSGSRLDKIKITRQTPGSLTKSDIFVNLKEIREGTQADVLLQHNDVVDVPGAAGTKKFFKDLLRSIVPVFTRTPVIIP